MNIEVVIWHFALFLCVFSGFYSGFFNATKLCLGVRRILHLLVTSGRCFGPCVV